MKKIFLLLFICCVFQTQAQFKYDHLTDTQKQQVKAIETVYNTATRQQATVTYNEYMLKITLAEEEKQFLPLVDIEAITIEESKGNYFLKLLHSGGWEYSGLYKMGKENTETVKVKLQNFLNDFEPFGEELSAELCDSARYLKTSTDDDNFYDFEYKMLRLAGITDIDNANDVEIKRNMSKLWKKHDFECLSSTHIYPKGNFFRQLARIDGEDAFELLLDNYGFDPNMIDRDGCSL